MRKWFILLMALVLMMGGCACAETAVLSQQCQLIKQAEAAIQGKYGLTPEMHTFFIREIAEAEDGSMTVSLTGADDFYFVLGTYTGTAGPAGQSAAWNNEGKSTEGGFSAEAWGIPQLEKMLAITQKDHEVVDFYPQAQAIAMENDAAYAPREGSLTDEARWECPEHEVIEAQSKYTADELNGLAKDAIRQVYGLSDEALSLMEEVDDEPDFRFVMEGDTLMFHAWFALTQNPSDDPNEWPEWTAGDGQYVVVINSETGVVEDVIYDTCLNGNG